MNKRYLLIFRDENGNLCYCIIEPNRKSFNNYNKKLLDYEGYQVCTEKHLIAHKVKDNTGDVFRFKYIESEFKFMSFQDTETEKLCEVYKIIEHLSTEELFQQVDNFFSMSTQPN